MCNINVVIAKDKKKTNKVTECLNVVTHLSYQSNSDGDGYFTEGFKVKKSVDKQIIRGNHWLGVSHQRFSTSGKIAEMTQPIESEHFIFVHNGIFRGNNAGDAKVSDSHKVLIAIEDSYEDTHDLKTTLKLLLKEQDGYWSCIIYDKTTKELLYFKDRTSTMFMVNHEDYILMSTKKINVEYMQKYFGINEEIIEPDPFIFFDMLDNFKELDTHKEYITPVVSANKWWNSKGNLTSKITGDNFASDGVMKLRQLLYDYYVKVYSIARGVDKDKDAYYLIGINTDSSKTQLEACFGEYIHPARSNRGIQYYTIFEEDFITIYDAERLREEESEYYLEGVV